MPKASDMVRTEVTRLSPYNSGLTIAEVMQRYAPARIAKLGSNENPLGPSPTLATMMQAGAEMFRLYPDPAGRELRQAIAAKYAFGDDQIILGNGSEDLLSIISRAVLRPHDTVVTLYPSFPLHEDYATLMGARVERVTVNDDLTINVDALIEAVRKRPRMLLFSNPMNPVGSWLSAGDLSKVLNAAGDETLVVVDEAYAEYAEGDDYASSLPYLCKRDRPWIVLRTFSKAFGLAGLRIGFGIVGDPQLRALLDRVRTPFNVNGMAQAAALAARRTRNTLQGSSRWPRRKERGSRASSGTWASTSPLPAAISCSSTAGKMPPPSPRACCAKASSSNRGSSKISTPMCVSASARQRRTTTSWRRCRACCDFPKAMLNCLARTGHDIGRSAVPNGVFRRWRIPFRPTASVQPLGPVSLPGHLDDARHA